MPQVTRPAASTRLRSRKRLTSTHQNPKRLRQPSRFPLYMHVRWLTALPLRPSGTPGAAAWQLVLSAGAGRCRPGQGPCATWGARPRPCPSPVAAAGVLLGPWAVAEPPARPQITPHCHHCGLPQKEGKAEGRGRATAKPWKSEFAAKTSVQMILKSRTSWLFSFLDAHVLTWLVPAVYQGQCLWRTEIKPVGVLHYKMERGELTREWTEMFVVSTIIFPNFPFNCEDQIQKTSLSPCLKTHGALAFKHALYGNLKDTVHVLRTQAM